MAHATGIVPFWKNYDRKTVVRFARMAEDLGYDSIWIPEAWAYEQFQLLTDRTRDLADQARDRSPTSFSRSAGVLAMSAATLDEISEGRVISARTSVARS
jgi:alkanesulfonate monooxygenase SsuD/methylene tetrahydromethanopterin reductase-like flavin-dependent oxidoreductase (luciferase family)